MREIFLTWEPLILAIIMCIGVIWWACRDPSPRGMNRGQVIITWIRLNITRRPRIVGELHGMPLYRCWCPSHGYFEDVPRGWSETMTCPTCFENVMGVSDI